MTPSQSTRRSSPRTLGLVLALVSLPWLTGCSTMEAAVGQGLDRLAAMRAPKPTAPSASSPSELLAQAPTAMGVPTPSLKVSPLPPGPGSPTAALATETAQSRTLAMPSLLVSESLEDQNRHAVGAPTDPLRPDTTLNLDDRNASKDLWVRVRKGFALPQIDTELVGEHERWYASRPDYVQRMGERANRYLYHVVEEVERRKMPAELALLPFIESAFNPQALSSARASGIWQFMPATGKDYELKQNLFRDDRRDVLASTRAALDHLQRLHRMFGDWHLVLAAYNWGEGNVQRAMSKNAKAGLPTDYLSLTLPPETRHYVPKLHAVRNIVARPDAFGLVLPVIENHPYFVSVPLQRDMDVAVAARLAELSLSDFQALNPSMNKPVILAAGTPQVLLPYSNASRFMHNLARNKAPLATWTAWVAPRTMRPSEVARLVGMNENALKDVNRIPQKMLVKAGSTLLVPRSHSRTEDVSEHVADNAMMALAPDVPPVRKMTLRAGKRDSVASIARKYKLNASQVAQWNKVGATARFKRGQAIVVYVPVQSRAMAASAQKSDRKGGRVTKGNKSRPDARKLASNSGNKRKVTSTASGKSRQSAPSSQRKVRVAAR